MLITYKIYESLFVGLCSKMKGGEVWKKSIEN